MAAVGSTSALAQKSIVYNGIECAYRSDATWVPSTPGLYGFNGTVTYCPIVQQAGEGYNFTNLSYVMLYGINITNPRLCKRNGSGTVACGTNAAIGSDAWILYKPAGGNQYDDAFLSVNVGSGVSLIRRYAVAWND
jgi:hypothetical protein